MLLKSYVRLLHVPVIHVAPEFLLTICLGQSAQQDFKQPNEIE